MSTLRATRGDTVNYRFTCVDADGAPLNLSGAAATMSVKRYITDADAIIEKTESDGLTLVVPESGGLIDLELLPEDTDGLTGHYRWDLEVTIGTSVFTLDGGLLFVVGDVTRAEGS